MTLAATEFLRRFFLHVLPRGFLFRNKPIKASIRAARECSQRIAYDSLRRDVSRKYIAKLWILLISNPNNAS
jgi:hypothetical protein